MRKILIGAIILSLSIPSVAEVKFRDVPADHWAAKAVYDLVKLGITSGYPDGTFRGTKNITRYEAAIFLSKLAEKMGAGEAERIKEDLKSIKDDIVKLKRSGGGAALNGSFDLNAMMTSLLATKGISGKGPIINYRLRTTLQEELSESASVKVNFDTMDAGFYGGQRDLAREMIDLQGKLRLNPVDLGLLGDLLSSPLDFKITAGPGTVKHYDATGIASSENDICYLRPDTGIDVHTKFGELLVSGNYLVKSFDKNYNGKVETNYGSLTLGYNFTKFPGLKNLWTEANTAIYAKNPNSGGPRDYRWKLKLASDLSPKVSLDLSLAASNRPESNGMMAQAGLSLTNFMAEGLSLGLKGTKVGNQFMPDELAAEELGEAGFDAFMRPLENSTANIDLEFSQTLTDKISFKGKGAVRLSSDYKYGEDKPKSRQTWQFGFSYLPARDVAIDGYYRVNQEPTLKETTDLSALVMTYKF